MDTTTEVEVTERTAEMVQLTQAEQVTPTPETLLPVDGTVPTTDGAPTDGVVADEVLADGGVGIGPGFTAGGDTNEDVPTPVDGDVSIDAIVGDVSASDVVAEPAGMAADLNQSIGFVDFSWAADLIDRGGPVVIILLCMSVIALAVILLKLPMFVWRGVGSGRGIEPALAAWIRGDAARALESLDASRTPTALVARHAMSGLVRGADLALVREDAERVALYQLERLKAYLRVLEATSQVAPLLGLFGTVIGMMAAFGALQASGADADPAALAGGIWVALITTAVGLAVAIPAALALYWFEGAITAERGHMERTLTSIFTARLEGRGDDPAYFNPPRDEPVAYAAQ